MKANSKQRLALWLAGFVLAACSTTRSADNSTEPLLNRSEKPEVLEPALDAGLDAGPVCSDSSELLLTAISPELGPATGGTSVTLIGCGFQVGGAQGVVVYFGKRAARVMAFESDTRLVVETPIGTVGETVDVMMVFDDGRPSTQDKAFTYTQ